MQLPSRHEKPYLSPEKNRANIQTGQFSDDGKMNMVLYRKTVL
jgi:hypothetical protein